MSLVHMNSIVNHTNPHYKLPGVQPRKHQSHNAYDTVQSQLPSSKSIGTHWPNLILRASVCLGMADVIECPEQGIYV